MGDILKTIITCEKYPEIETFVLNAIVRLYFTLLNGTEAPNAMKLEIWNEVIKTNKPSLILEKLKAIYESKLVIKKITKFKKRIEDKSDTSASEDLLQFLMRDVFHVE